jgi:hypothetical protein
MSEVAVSSCSDPVKLQFLHVMQSTLFRKFETNITRNEPARPLVPNFYIHVSVNDLYIPTIGPPILL